jgi:hypothetical protein
MLVQTSFNPLPQPQTCHTGVIVAGSTVSDYAAALMQLSHVKFLGHAHFRIARNTYDTRRSHPSWADHLDMAPAEVGKSIPQKRFYYRTTPLTTHIAMLARVATYGRLNAAASGANPQLQVFLNTTAGASLDTGVLYGEGVVYIDGANDNPNGFRGSIYSTANLDSNSADFGRPLIVPSANRGDTLAVVVAAQDCKLISLDLFDIHQTEVTP